MKVKEMIEVLSKCDPEKEIIVSLQDHIPDDLDFVFICGWPNKGGWLNGRRPRIMDGTKIVNS